MEKVHKKKGDFRFKAKGNSMNSAIQNDDITTLSPLGKYLPGPGEIVAYRLADHNELIIHRIIKVKNGHYSIRGDNANYTHKDIPLKDIIGVVTKVERHGKSIFWIGRYHSSNSAKISLRIYLIKNRLLRLSKLIINKFLK